MKILTVCRAGLVRSVALMDVLKLHFEPVDVLAVGKDFNTRETIEMLSDWADYIIVMEAHYIDAISAHHRNKVFVCEVGPDVWGTPKSNNLLSKVWGWARENQKNLGISEHERVI